MVNPGQSRSMVLFLVGLLAAGGCGSDSPTAVLPTDFTIAAGSTTISLARGATVSTFVKASRAAGFTGAISFGISGAANLTTGIFSTSVPDSARIDLVAGATVPTGTATFDVTARHPGSAPQKLTITVSITAAASGSLER